MTLYQKKEDFNACKRAQNFPVVDWASGRRTWCIQALLAAIPENSGMAYVLVQRISTQPLKVFWQIF